MGKRPRTPHFITGLGDGNVGQQLRKSTNNNKGLEQAGMSVAAGKFKKPTSSYIRKRASERLVRMEQPAPGVDHWTDVFHSGNSGDGIPRPVSTAGPWQVSASCLLGMIVILSAVFLHLVTDKVKRKKTDEWSEDDFTVSTDSASSLQSSINFSELKLQEVIGGGGFGQVWKAMWRGTPVAVKVLTGTAQSKKVSKAILEEFAAEINLLKGMRHPNICLYMGACLEPPNRAIVTELAANGSVWDALRLPLAPPFLPGDGVTRDGWPLHLYQPDPRHGLPPSFAMRKDPPIPPKGSWSWFLVKKVACGAARGMAYLHSGKPPVLHRDLKSANLLLDESYTTKVCDFGLSRLKSQNQSMTGNCGTVQWMAPEVLGNQKYAESADVFSYGIICWELLTRECPYDGMSAIQCALAVLHRDHRPEVPAWCPPAVSALIKTCLKRDPESRPTFTQIILALDAMP